MSAATAIEWTDSTWNPIRGCSRVSEGCTGCYAEAVAGRFSGPGLPYAGTITQTTAGPRWNGRIKFVDSAFDQPLRWTRPRRIFVNSMSDLFHENLSNEHIAEIFGVMAMAQRHTFQVLTKRATRMREWFEWIANDADGGTWGCILHARQRLGIAGWKHEPCDDGPEWPLPNVFLGVSAENQATANERIPQLLRTPATVRFVSLEPLLGSIDLTRLDARQAQKWNLVQVNAIAERNALDGSHVSDLGIEYSGTRRLNWVIVGGESGTRARPMHPDWTRSLRDQCVAAKVPYFFKQWGEWWEVDGDSRDPATNDHFVIDVGSIEASELFDPQTDCLIALDGRVFLSLEGLPEDTKLRHMKRLGKKAAGRHLDGRTWDEVPQ